MEPNRLPYAETDRFAPLVLDHLERKSFVEELSEFPPTRDGLLQAAGQRQFPNNIRLQLSEVLHQQYTAVDMHPAVRSNLDALSRPDSLTVTTGHQLCLFTGPLYVPLKILNTIKVSTELGKQLDRPVIPIFWMASEDHDRPEIDHAWITGKKVQWPGEIGGAVGRMELQGIEAIIEQVSELLGPGRNADRLRGTIDRCYKPEFTLAKATRLFVNELFGRFGIICLDADDASLKRSFIPIMRSELNEKITQRTVQGTTIKIGQAYKVQAHPREINLFHMSSGMRARILENNDGTFEIEGVAKRSREQLLAELESHPEHFSPNVLLRPLYQETILPNIAYIGGGGELAYWLQLRGLFEELHTPMPVLLLRSSAAILPEKEFRRAKDLGLAIKDLFHPIEELRKRVALVKAGFATDLDREREAFRSMFDQLNERARSIDPTLERSAGSAAHLANKGLDHLEKRFVRVAKARARNELDRLQMVLDVLFPNKGMQERRENFMTFYLRHGDGLFDRLLEQLDPLDPQFTVFVERSLTDQ